jgi:ubiquinone/menaquinone biosynthesis C-methylase UbiE
MPHVCPIWIGRLLASPARKLLENPDSMLGPFVCKGMTVLEPGCGMGFFTLPLARMVGETGRVVVVDVQEQMLQGLKKRAAKAGLLERIECRLATGDGSCISDLRERVDFAAAINMVHETPDPAAFIRELADTIKPGGRLLILEPSGHVSQSEFQATMDMACDADMSLIEHSRLRAVFVK